MLKRNMFIKLFLPILFCFALMFNVVCLASGNSIYDDVVSTEVPQTLLDIVGVMVWIAMVIAVFKLVQIGFKFLLGAGNARSSQEAKAAIIPWLIGVGICALYLSLSDIVIKAVTSGVGTDIFG